MKKVVLLKDLGRNKKGYVSYPSDRTGFFMFKGFEVSPEAIEDDPTLFKVINYTTKGEENAGTKVNDPRVRSTGKE